MIPAVAEELHGIDLSDPFSAMLLADDLEDIGRVEM